MGIPRINQTIQDGALGIGEGDASAVQVKIGVCSSGTANILAFYSDITTMRAAMGEGPAVEAAAHVLSTAGGRVGIMRINSSVAGSVGSVTKVGTGTGTMTVAGAALDNYDAIVAIQRDGTNIAAGTGTFKYSLDGGDVYSPDIAIPTGGVYAIPNSGVTITFVNGGSGTSFIKGDTHSFTGTAPGYSSTDVTNALVALRADPAQWGFYHLVGAASTVSGAATIAAVLDVQNAAAEAQYRYMFGIMECPEDTDANIKTAFASFTSSRVGVAAGSCELVSSISGRIYKRNAAWPVTARIAQQDARRDVARFSDDGGEGGALEGVSKLYRDEYVTEALDEARFITLRTFPGVSGFFVTNGRLMASASSDYKFIQFRRLMDIACAINYTAMLKYLNDDAVRVEDVTGFINAKDAKAIETTVAAKIRAETLDKDRVSDVEVIIKRDTNILSTQTLVETVRIIPKGYSKFIEATIGFFNPAFAPKAA